MIRWTTCYGGVPTARAPVPAAQTLSSLVRLRLLVCHQLTFNPSATTPTASTDCMRKQMDAKRMLHLAGLWPLASRPTAHWAPALAALRCITILVCCSSTTVASSLHSRLCKMMRRGRESWLVGAQQQMPRQQLQGQGQGHCKGKGKQQSGQTAGFYIHYDFCIHYAVSTDAA